ncbi:MAG: radical SAM protein, partial [Verrucomicrobiota bacterium]|nr:radical SAM protein [Verrucomicrobiota bacterium]
EARSMKKYKHLFGPVPSRRFGRSLGVDLTPHKTCNFDCIFCQLGRTTLKTMDRREYVPVEEVIEELGDWIESSGEADYITLSGSGEPTLHSHFDEVIEFARKASSIPVALLTNGALLGNAGVRAAASKANVVKVSLSAGNPDSFKYINRPHPDLVFEDVIAGMQAFREEFSGQLWLEVFMIWGVNSTQKEVLQIAELAQSIQPDRIQLNTAVRPPAKGFVHPIPKEKLEQLVDYFTPKAEVIAEFSSDFTPSTKANEETILAMLQRRPCTAKEISAVLGLHPNEVSKYIGKLERTNRIHSESAKDGSYYTAP